MAEGVGSSAQRYSRAPHTRRSLPHSHPPDSVDRQTSAARSIRAHSMLYWRASPESEQRRLRPAGHDELEALITAARGRTLALFTSGRSMARRTRPARPGVGPSDHATAKPALVRAFADGAETASSPRTDCSRPSTSGAPCRSCDDRIPSPAPTAMLSRAAEAGPTASPMDIPRASMMRAQAAELSRTADERGVVAVMTRVWDRPTDGNRQPSAGEAHAPPRGGRDALRDHRDTA